MERSPELDRRESLRILERRTTSALDLESEMGVPRTSSTCFRLEDLQKSFHSARLDKHRLPTHDIPLSITDLGLSQTCADHLLGEYGRNEIVERRRSKLALLLAQLTAPMPVGIWIAIVVEFALRSWIDAAILFFLQMLNCIMAFVEETRAADAIAALKKKINPTAVVFRDSRAQTIDAALIVPGDCVVLSQGVKVPADCVMASGIVSLDQSMITGESLPIHCQHGAQLSMGAVVVSGCGNAMVIATGMRTFFGKTTAMIQPLGPEPVSPLTPAQMAMDQHGELRHILIQVVLVLLGLSLVVCITTLSFLLLEGQPLKQSIGYVIVLAVVSIPLTIQVVVTATLALGSRQLSEHQVIVADLSAIERLSGISVLCSDKTGTLTQNEMVVQDECPVYMPGLTRDDVLLFAALAANFNLPAENALDKMIMSEAVLARCQVYDVLDHTPFDATLKRTESTVRNRVTGESFRVAKGAPHTVLDLCVNKTEVEASVIRTIYDLADRGVRCLGVAKSPSQTLSYEFTGILAFLDPPRPDSASTIAALNDYGIEVKMITGDHLLIAVETCRTLHLGKADVVSCDTGVLPTIQLQGTRVSVPETLGRDFAPLIMEKDGFASALPEHKFLIVSALKQAGVICAMTGDGVNDAPALKVASVGIAVSGATDAARAAADIVLTAPGLNSIAIAVLIARQIFLRMSTFLIYRIAATLQLLVFFFLGTLILRPVQYNAAFPPFWSMPVLSLIIVTVLNDIAIISIAYDNVPVPKLPQTWHLGRLWGMSVLLGSVACASSLLLLWLALNSNWRTFLKRFSLLLILIGTKLVVGPGSLMDRLGFVEASFGRIINIMYLKISLSDFLTIFSARTGPNCFFKSRPGWQILVATVVAVSASTLIALLWDFFGESEPISGEWALFIWIWCLVSFVVQDSIKVVVVKLALTVSNRRHLGAPKAPVVDLNGTCVETSHIAAPA